MSTFKVSIERIVKIEPHENAQRLELATILGWQTVVPKGQYVVGQLVVYIPIDSILPIEVESKLFGPDSKIKLSKSRVKTIKLRGAISQGMVAPLATFEITKAKQGMDLTDTLKITKYEPPAPKFNGTPGVANKPAYNNPNFHKYGGIENFKNYPDLFKEGELVHITEKVHGCLQAETMISLPDGSRKTIKEIVNNKEITHVLGMNNNGQVVPTRILNYFDNGITQGWKKITFSRKNAGRGNSFGTILCTPNHKFYNPATKTYTACSELKEKDMVLLMRTDPHIDYVVRETMKGKMLGDGSLSAGAISFGHKVAHEDYLKYTMHMLGPLAGNQQKNQMSGYGTEMCRAKTISNYAINDLFIDWFVSGKKEVPENFFLSPISLAFWYMDDGSLSTHPDQNDRAAIATNGFNEDSIDNLLIALERLELMAVKYFSNGWRLRFNSDAAHKLFTLISPYVPECMQYKLPALYRQGSKVFLPNDFEIGYKPTLVAQTILKIENVVSDKINKTRYDLETEAHNFIADSLVVHNSNFRAGYVKTHANTLVKKIKKLFGMLPEYEFVYGSNNQQLQDKWLYAGFYDKNVYAEAVVNYKLREVLKPGEVVYGEIYGDGIQKGYTYGCKAGERKLALFDLRIEGEYVVPTIFAKFCAERSLPRVQTLFIGPFNRQTAKDLTMGPSVFEPSQKVREGVVIRPLVEEKTFMGRKLLKLISDEYLLGDNTDFH